jgi:hypothetical protein
VSVRAAPRLVGKRAALVVLAALALVGGRDSANGQLASSVLPEREGLAARYPADEGLRRDPAVVFTDDAEAATGEALTKGFARDHPAAWNNAWDQAWGRMPVAREPSNVHAGRQSLELTLDRPGGAGTSKDFSPGFDRLFLRYYIKYDAGFPGAHHVGGAFESRAPGVPHAHPGIRPDGANKFTVLLDHWAFDRSVRPPGHLVAYVYHMDQQHQWGEQFYPSGKTQPGVNGARGLFGPSFVRRGDFVPERGRWYCYELMVQANTPGERDGRVAFWVDGRLMGDFPNLRFRTVETLKINRVDLGLYESRPMPVQRVWIDDVVVATSYVGPMVPKRD